MKESTVGTDQRSRQVSLIFRHEDDTGATRHGGRRRRRLEGTRVAHRSADRRRGPFGVAHTTSFPTAHLTRCLHQRHKQRKVIGHGAQSRIVLYNLDVGRCEAACRSNEHAVWRPLAAGRKAVQPGKRGRMWVDGVNKVEVVARSRGGHEGGLDQLVTDSVRWLTLVEVANDDDLTCLRLRQVGGERFEFTSACTGRQPKVQRDNEKAGAGKVSLEAAIGDASRQAERDPTQEDDAVRRWHRRRNIRRVVHVANSSVGEQAL
mmetsp:Transcript_14374/g.45226  ORF Transcript_14374/g.45226 Transcript_14374/m.45226 type:complete len:262 (-) Transcript_14374:848-1633(-)